MQSIVEAQKTYFKTHETKTYQHRLEALTRLERVIVDNEEAIKEALKADLNKSGFESYTTEIGFTLHSLKKAKKHLKRWMKPKKQRTPLFFRVHQKLHPPRAQGNGTDYRPLQLSVSIGC